MATLQDQYKKNVIPKMEKEFHYGNSLAVPRIEKTVVNMGIGRVQDKKERESIKNMLALITAQVPQDRPAKKSIASFKTREGMLVGYRVTLRGSRMYDFLARLIRIAIPRMRDFRGIPLSSVDEGGNLNIGIREHIIFPELISEDVTKIYSLQITVVTSAKTRDEAIQLFRLLGFPLERPGKTQ